MKELIIRSITSILLIYLLYLSYVYNYLFNFLIIFLGILSSIEFLLIIQKIKIKKIISYFIILIGFSYFILVNFFLFAIAQDFKDIIFYSIIVCIGTDIGGLISGKIFKGKKLTKISPNKTYSGVYGSFAASFLIMFFANNFLNIDYFLLVVFTFSVSLLSQFGDLFFSFLKRKAKVKDTGKLLPGHGGILDRIDGIIISVPFNIFIYTLST